MNARLACLLVSMMLAAVGAPSIAADLGRPMMLIADPQLKHAVYGGSILMAAPIGDGWHIGFIVNRPTRIKLGQLFPEHSPSQKVVDPVYFGGPSDGELLFAVVARSSSPGGLSMAVGNGLYLTFDGATVDRIIESEPEHARFFTGLVVWRSGELEEEVNRGLWHVETPEPGVVLRKSTKGLWEEMVTRPRLMARAVRAKPARSCDATEGA